MYLIIGGDSTIGLALSNYWTENNIPFHASTRNQELVSVQRPVIDLLNKSTFKEISGYKSAVICAAVTDMATCEEKPDETRAVNVTGTIKLIKKLEEKENHIVFLSTNQLLNSAKKMIPSSFTLLILLKTFTSIVPDEVINFFQSHITS